jgi:cytochrome P450
MAMTTVTDGEATNSGPYYDPYDFEVDSNPYPIWARMREEAPLYYNEKYDFYALTRYQDVQPALVDWEHYRSGRGTLLEIIRAGYPIPDGMFLMEDPPEHDVHRSILVRVFTPNKMLAIEPQVRNFCAATLDGLAGRDRFDLVTELASELPMRVIGMLLGIPESDQVAIRNSGEEGRRLTEGAPKPPSGADVERANETFGEYLDWRAKNPSDDLMTALLTAEFETDGGETRRLSRTEILTQLSLLAGAGNETTQRLIGWIGKVLGDHPDQLREVVADRSLIPNVVEEVLRFEAPSPIQSRYVIEDIEVHGRVVAEGSVMVLLNGAANRDSRQFPDGDSFDVHRRVAKHLSFGVGLHFCMGAALARLEGRVALEEMLKRWSHWEVDMDGAVQARTSTTRGWANLPVVIG